MLILSHQSTTIQDSQPMGHCTHPPENSAPSILGNLSLLKRQSIFKSLKRFIG